MSRIRFVGDRARKGKDGPRGPDGESAYQIAVANGFVGTEAQWLASLIGLPGEDGTDGTNGSSATLSVGTTTTGLAGSNASVTNSGTSAAAVFNFTIPRGQDGINGSAATISVGTTTTGTPSTPASVINVGTSSAAVLNFVIPKGEAGSPGISKRIVTLSGTTDASGNVAFTFSPAFSATPHIAVMLQAGNTRQFSRITAASATGCTVNAFQQNQTLLSLLGLDILTAGVTAISGATIRILATDMA